MYGPGYQTTPTPKLAAGDWVDDKKRRVKEHRYRIWETLADRGPGMQAHWVYFLSKLIASLGTIVLFAAIFAISGSVLFWDSSELSVFVTNTFYTTNDNEQNISWPILTQPSWNGMPRNPATYYNDIKFEHYYECMWTAQIGWGLCNGSAATITSYQQCLQSNYAPQLTLCSGMSSSFSWPTANVYSNCITNNLGANARWNLNAFKTCIHEDLWPLYEIPQDVDSLFFLGSFSWPLLMLTGAFLFGVFALYTIYPVDWEDTAIIEHGKPLSAYTRLGVAWTVLPLVFTLFWFIVMALVAFRASPTWPNQNTNLYPSTQQTNVVVVTASLAVLFYFLLEAAEFYEKNMYEHGGSHYKDPEPSGDIVFPVKPDHHAPPEDPFKPRAHGGIPAPATMAQARATKIFMFPPNAPRAGALMGAMRGGLGYYFPGLGQTITVGSLRDASEMYTPVLLNTWSDAYLVDPLFFVGALGATMQLITADVYNIFWCLVYYRIAHAGVARLLYHAYVRSPDGDGDELNKAREGIVERPETENAEAARDSIVATRVLALAVHIAGCVALFVVFTILFDTSRIFTEFPTTQNLFIVGLLVPEVIRFLGHVALALIPAHRAHSFGVYILMVAQFLWAWDIVVRTSFLCVYFWGASSGRGTKPFLLSGFSSINSMMQFTASCCPSSATGYTVVNNISTLLCC